MLQEIDKIQDFVDFTNNLFNLSRLLIKHRIFLYEKNMIT